MRLFFTILFIIGLSCEGYCQNRSFAVVGGTSITILATSSGICYGADSKAKLVLTVMNDKSQIDSVNCKIVTAKNIIAASAGSFCASYQNNVCVYDVFDEVKKAILTATSLHQTIQIFTDRTNKYLRQFLGGIKVSNPKQFDSLFRSNLLIETGIGTLIKGDYYLGIIEFKLKGNRNKWHIDTTYTVHKSQPTFVALGEADVINNYIKLNKTYFNETNLIVYKMENLIRMEIQAKPEHVGEPIDVIILLPEGPRWLTKIRTCHY